MAPDERRREWSRAGAEVVVFDPAGDGVPLDAMFADLGKRDVQLVLLEGGPTLAWSAVREGLVDRVVLFLAPKLVGGAGAPGILGGEGLAPIAEALALEIVDVARVGPDIKVEARVHRDR